MYIPCKRTISTKETGGCVLTVLHPFSEKIQISSLSSYALQLALSISLFQYTSLTTSLHQLMPTTIPIYWMPSFTVVQTLLLLANTIFHCFKTNGTCIGVLHLPYLFSRFIYSLTYRQAISF